MADLHDSKLTDEIEAFLALAFLNQESQSIGQLLATSYPQTAGEWLWQAVITGATASGQTHWALVPMAPAGTQPGDVARQGRDSIKQYGAVLIGAIESAGLIDDDIIISDAVSAVIDEWDEAADERNALMHSLAALGEAVRIYSTYRDRDSEPPSEVAGKLLEAVGQAALALAVADEPPPDWHPAPWLTVAAV
jgi:hypothetical protein